MNGMSDDQSLVARAAQGDSLAFELLYRRHRAWALALASRLGPADDALGLVQDAFSHLLSRFPGFVLQSSMRAYLFPVLKNLAISRARRRKLRPQAWEQSLLEALPARETESADLGLRSRIEALSRDHQAVVLLRFYLDFRIPEIAAALEVPEGTVKSRLHHALARLRSALGDETQQD